jgi:starch synthase
VSPPDTKNFFARGITPRYAYQDQGNIMSMPASQSVITSLCRFSLREEDLVQSSLVKTEIALSFDEKRAYPFIPDSALVDAIRRGDSIDGLRGRFGDIKNAIFDTMASGDSAIRMRLASDTRLSERITNAVCLVHRALAEGNFTSLVDRRFVIIKERPGRPTFYHVSNETTVIAHVGGGPVWSEIASIYLGLKTFDMLEGEEKLGGKALFEDFLRLLAVEERAIETGYLLTETYPPDFSRSLNELVDAVIAYSTQGEAEIAAEPEKKEEKTFTAKNRENYLRLLDARRADDMMNYDYDKNIKGLHGLERLAKRYKRDGNRQSLREVVRLLVAASGHDIHEVRNRANIILERILSPKEFDAPLATTFYNIHVGERFEFRFSLPDANSGYLLRIYRNSSDSEFFVESEIDCSEYPLVRDEKGYSATVAFDTYGHYDFTVVHAGRKEVWVTEHGTSGRVNVIPDLRGELVIEVFTDIHGHSKVYWRDESGHPGLVYNENGEIIRLGRFSDVTAHLADMKERYNCTALYVLGAQKRGSNREDWAPEASSPSPFSPMSLIEIEPSLGGEEEFIELVKHAHELEIKVIVDVIPHVNRRSTEVRDENVVFCYGEDGQLYPRASTDGRYGSWNDGKLLNYRRFEVWEWLSDSVVTLIEKFDIDGIRFDSAHAVPIMMKKNNFPFFYDKRRSHEEMVEGKIIVNDRWDEHFITTGYYDCQCRDSIAIPFHFHLMLNVERALRRSGKKFFLNIAECFWGHERFLSRIGIVPYNASLFKINESIMHGKSDVREIYHIYDNYYPSVLCSGTELLGIIGNHDERRALNTFGHRGLRAAVTLTSFMSNIVMDFEGSAEGESWKVYLDNIYVNWNQFEYASHRSLESFYADIYKFHRRLKGKGYLLWANNNMVASAIKHVGNDFWIAACNYSDWNQTASLQFDNPAIPIEDDSFYRLVDIVYSPITKHYSYYTGRELRVSRVNTVVPYTDRVKLLRLEKVGDINQVYDHFLRDSFFRLCSLSHMGRFSEHFAFRELFARVVIPDDLERFLSEKLIPQFWNEHRYFLELGLKRCFYQMYRTGLVSGGDIFSFFELMKKSTDERIAALGKSLLKHNRRGTWIFMSAEADPFSKSGGLANVVYELPRELVKTGEEIIVITALYRSGDDKAMAKMRANIEKYKIKYTGVNVRFMILGTNYEVGVHTGMVEGIRYYFLDHFELFDGLYWGLTSEEKLRRRVGFARASAEVICTFGLQPLFTFTNDAFAGLFNGIVRSDHVYASNPNFTGTTFLHIIHNGGWQYFDSYHRYEKGFDLFRLFNLPEWRANDFTDPVHGGRLNCMAAGIRFSDRSITVSPSYAKQIEYQCDGLEHILRNVIGISNAVGRDLRSRIEKKFADSQFAKRNHPLLLAELKANKKLHAKIESRYPEILKGEAAVQAIRDDKRRYIVYRVMLKLLLQIERRLDVDPDKIIFVMIHRVTEQKGFQLLLDCSEGLFKHLGFQCVAGGAVSSGDRKGEEIAHGLWLLSQYYGRSANICLGFQEVSVPLLAGDIFCMPSMSEPGGISQLEALCCGSLVVARATGGLRDTIFPLRRTGDAIEGNGFLFADYSSRAFYDAMERAHKFFTENNEDTIYQVRMNAERSVYFWDRPAREYIDKCYDIKEIIRMI